MQNCVARQFGTTTVMFPTCEQYADDLPVDVHSVTSQISSFIMYIAWVESFFIAYFGGPQLFGPQMEIFASRSYAELIWKS